MILKKLGDGDLNLPGIEDIGGSGIITTSTSQYTRTFGAVPSEDERLDPQRRLREASDRRLLGLDPKDI